MAVCEHLLPLERELIAAGHRETYRGRPWSRNCREWVYFPVELDRESLRRRLALPAFVTDHEHRGTHDGSEAGFVCTLCRDAVMGRHPAARARRFG